MSNKQFKGKALYNPSGRAGEYSYWAANFYNGCSNDCQYCYCKKGVLSTTWSKTPTLKKCFKNEQDAIAIFRKELGKNLQDVREHGIFFTFTTDPFLPETRELHIQAIIECLSLNIPVKVLTKRVDWGELFFDEHPLFLQACNAKELLAFGFTLTGHDELEGGASSNADRIFVMSKLKKNGYKTFASIEPIIDFKSSLEMIAVTAFCCDLYKVGTMSGKKYDMNETQQFIVDVCALAVSLNTKIYFKDSILKHAGLTRELLVDFIRPDILVDRDYNMFAVPVNLN